MPKRTKSVTMTTNVTSHVRAATMEANKAPQTPAPRARRKAMNASPQATGCRIITRVRAFVVSVLAVLKLVLSMVDITSTGL